MQLSGLPGIPLMLFPLPGHPRHQLPFPLPKPKGM
jgi:hypothetical protein